MAPEQINGSCLSLKVDVWAYGVIMWEIAMEMPPYSDIPNTMNSLRTAINEKGCNADHREVCFILTDAVNCRASIAN